MSNMRSNEDKLQETVVVLSGVVRRELLDVSYTKTVDEVLVMDQQELVEATLMLSRCLLNRWAPR